MIHTSTHFIKVAKCMLRNEISIMVTVADPVNPISELGIKLWHGIC